MLCLNAAFSALTTMLLHSVAATVSCAQAQAIRADTVLIILTHNNVLTSTAQQQDEGHYSSC
jgi:hypothetical protein